MRKYLLSLAVPFLLTDPSLADEKVIVTRHDCQRLVTHVPDPGVAYRPGVDARGRPVVPADLPGSPSIRLPDEVAIDIGIDLAKKYGMGGNGSLYTGEATLGRVTVRDGKVLFNGQPVSDADTAAVAEACRARAAGR